MSIPQTPGEPWPATPGAPDRRDVRAQGQRRTATLRTGLIAGSVAASLAIAVVAHAESTATSAEASGSTATTTATATSGSDTGASSGTTVVSGSTGSGQVTSAGS